VLACQHGGHCGFVGPAAGQDDGYWAENEIVDFTSSREHRSASARAPAPFLPPRA
jgi:predicted alpha/beta-fold hydrolase